MSNPKRSLTIATGSCKRLSKDVAYYMNEKAQFEAKYQTLTENGANRHELNRQRDFINETVATLEDTRLRFEAAHKELVNAVENFILGDCEELTKAEAVLKDSADLLNNKDQDDSKTNEQ